MKFFIEKEIEEIPRILRKRRKISLKKISSLLEEPILICGVSSSIDLPGWGIEEMADKLGINVKIRYSNEVSKGFPANTVIALSASGETEETIEALRNTKAKVKIAITGNKNSTITKCATHVIPLICGEYLSDSATKSVVEEYYIVKQLFSEKFSKYIPISDKEIKKIQGNLNLEFPQEIVDTFRRTNRVVVVGQKGFSQEVETKFEEVARIQSEAITGPLIFYSAIEVLNQGDVILVVDPERMENYRSALRKAARSRDIFYVNKLGIKGEGFYKTIIRYAGLLKLIVDIGKSKNVDIDHPEILARTTRGYKLPLFPKVKKIVLIGGGSGIPSLIRVFKKLGHNVTGITSMVDSGGSAGRLRQDYKVLPPGDIRRIIAALSDYLRGTEIMNYRFKGGSLDGHTLGNILIAALEKIEGFKDGKEEIEKMLMTKGKALPATLENCHIYAKLENGQILKGEDEIDIPLRNPFLKIKKVWLEPQARANPEAKKAILEADVIIIGPGDLYSTLIPSLLMKGIPETIKKSKAKKIYICNAMTKLGETVGFTVSDFIKEIEKYLGKGVLDFVIYNQRIPSRERILEYQKDAPFVFDYVKFNRKKLTKMKSPKVIGADLLTSPKGLIVHDPDVLAKIILSLI